MIEHEQNGTSCNRSRKNNIEIISHKKSLAVLDEDGYHILTSLFDTCAKPENIVELAHEIAHCVLDELYTFETSIYEQIKSETKALIWSIEYLIPREEYEEFAEKYFVEHSDITLWDFAEMYNVTYDFAFIASFYYQNGYINLQEISSILGRDNDDDDESDELNDEYTYE